MRFIVGTEAFLSERYSALWFEGAKRYLPVGVHVVVFDNNPAGRPESKQLVKRCRDLGFAYWRNLPYSTQADGVHALYRSAVNYGADVMVHLDIDCPPVAGLFDAVTEPLRRGAVVATDQGGAHCFAAHVSSVVCFAAQRLPHYPEDPTSEFSAVIKDAGDASGRRVFDHCRWMWHDLVRRGLRVEVLNLGVPHAGAPSWKDPASPRHEAVLSDPMWQDEVRLLHSRFWRDPRVRELMA